MELTLLGTGAPTGLPRPDCPCAACAARPRRRRARRDRPARRRRAAARPDPGRGARRRAAPGTRSPGVRQVLLTHPHDGPAVELPAGLPGGRAGAGRPQADADQRPPGARGAARRAGHRIRGDLAGRRAAALSAAGRRARREQRELRPYDMVVADVAGRPDALARLRAAGGIGPATDVIAVHIDHDVPPGRELERRLAALGARAVPDGTTLVVGEYHAVPDLPRRTLVLGGARSGKSVEAERRLQGFPGVVYVATGGCREGDREWAARVGLHRERRPATWRTEETCELARAARRAGAAAADRLSGAVADRRDGPGRRVGRREVGGGRRAGAAVSVRPSWSPRSAAPRARWWR